MNTVQRSGITAGGNWVVDRVKTVDILPSRGMLANIMTESVSTGGAPANVLEDLSRMGAVFPLAGTGVTGDDREGMFIRTKFEKLGVDITHLHTDGSVQTSYTDVMSEQGTGNRTFFHHRGANSLFGVEHVPVHSMECRIFHLGYILLLDSLDAPDRDYGTRGARLLHDLQKEGIKTSVDLVSEDSERFSRIVPPALTYADYLIMNEVEAGKVTGVQVRNEQEALDPDGLVHAGEALMEMGNMDFAAIHMPEGAYVHTSDGTLLSTGSLELPEGYIAGATGAGDAFCAGMLYGIHEGLSYDEMLKLATCAAGACLAGNDAGSGLVPVKDVLELGETYGFRDPVL